MDRSFGTGRYHVGGGASTVIEHIAAASVCGVVAFFAGFWLREPYRRAPMRLRFMSPSLHCTTCATIAKPNQRHALLALLRRDTSCSMCGNALWSRSITFELLLAFTAAVVGARFGFAWALPAYVVFFLALVTISIIDIKNYLIPNRIIYPALFTGAALLLLSAIVQGNVEQFGIALVGMVAAWLFFFITWVIYPAGMGFGDVRLAALIGLFAGWMQLGTVVIAIMLGLLLASIVGVILIALRRKSRKDPVPFGPFLAAGAAIAILAGAPLVKLLWGV